MSSASTPLRQPAPPPDGDRVADDLTDDELDALFQEGIDSGESIDGEPFMKELLAETERMAAAQPR